jgi:hypothetical protein
MQRIDTAKCDRSPNCFDAHQASAILQSEPDLRFFRYNLVTKKVGKQMTRIAKFTAIAAVVIAAPAFAAASLDANIELDNTYYNKEVDRLQQGGRVEVNIGSKTTVGSGFVAGRGTLILGEQGNVGVDDAWVEGGNDAFSLKLGRFEAADLGPLGKDTLVWGDAFGAGRFYRGNAGRGRGLKNSTDFHGTLNANLGSGVGFEFGLIETKNTLKETGFGYRPVVTFAAAGATVKLGVDKVNGENTGVAATAALKVAGGDVNVGYAQRKTMTTNTKNNTLTLNGTFGAFGAGLAVGKIDGVSANSLYAAYSVPFFVPAASLTLAASTGKLSGGDRETGLRARINYGF